MKVNLNGPVIRPGTRWQDTRRNRPFGVESVLNAEEVAMRLSRIALAVALVIPLVNALAWAAASSDAPDSGPSKPVVEAPADGERVGAEEVVNVNLRYTGGSRHVFQHAGATFIKVHFETLRLAPGDFVTVTDQAGDEKFTYHGDPTRQSAEALAKAGDSGFTVHRTKGFGAMSVTGDTAVVTLHTNAPGARGAAGTAVRIDRFFRGLSPQEEEQANPRPEVVCGTDARRDRVCFRNSNPAEFKTSAAVGRLIIDGGKALCTAFRVGLTNRLLTNNHCLSTPDQVMSSEVQFGFECRTCGGNDPKQGVKVSGAKLIKTDKNLDFTLFSVNNPRAIAQFGTLFLEANDPTDGEQIFVPGHGDDKPLQIAVFKSRQGGAPCTIDQAQGTATENVVLP